MSWSFNITGTLQGVREKIVDDVHIPAGIKSTLLEIVDEPLQGRTANGITVKGSGHSGGGYGYINELRTERVHIELGTPPAELPPASENTGPIPYPEGNPLKAD